MRRLIGATLRRQGYRVITAPDGEQAFTMVRSEAPDLVVTDWMMPRLTGPELIGMMKEDGRLASIPCVLLTARSDEESKLLGTERGADAFLGKPFNDKELVSIARNLLRLKAGERKVKELNDMLAHDVLKRYLPASVVDGIVAGRVQLTDAPRSMTATVLFADLCDFTGKIEELRAPRTARLLNQFLGRMTEVAFEHGGTVDKFMGDGMVILFGAPVEAPEDEHVAGAVQCARAMQDALAELNTAWATDGTTAFTMRIGVHTGPVVAGSFGGAARSEFGAIGPTVSLAAALESHCEPGAVWISAEVAARIPGTESEPAGTIDVPEIGATLEYHRVVAV